MPETQVSIAPKIITPTVGRVVWYYRDKDHYQGTLEVGDDSNEPGPQPLKADVCFVWNERLINVAGYNESGQSFRVENCILMQEGDPIPGADIPGAKIPFCTWMPYQLGQAKASPSA